MNRWKIHHVVYVGCLLIIATSLPLSNFMLSVGGIFLFINWLLEWNWKEKWSRLKQNKLALLLSLFFFLCTFCLINTEHLEYGMSNILNKLPFLYAPLILATSNELSGKEQRLILNGFLLGTLTGTIASIIFLFTHTIDDIREISLFISHIRFSLCIVLGICLALFLAFKVDAYTRWMRVSLVILSFWFCCYLFISQTLTGIAIGFLLIIFLFFYILFKKEIAFPYKKIVISSMFLIIAGASIYTCSIIYKYYHVKEETISELDNTSAGGNLYEHDLSSIIENGSPIMIYVQPRELSDTWEERSALPYTPHIEATLIRYLNSKGLRKDREGVLALTGKDIQNIENGIANIDYTRSINMKRSLYPILFGYSLYKRDNIVDHSSLFQRVELWKASLSVIKENKWLGIGIGDHKAAINGQLMKMDSSMKYKQNMGCHNQFLTYWLMGGIFLLLYFIFTLIFPLIVSNNARNLIYLCFFFILFFSFFTEDTLETQIGITLYAFFNSFFLFVFNMNKIRKESLLINKK